MGFDDDNVDVIIFGFFIARKLSAIVVATLVEWADDVVTKPDCLLTVDFGVGFKPEPFAVDTEVEVGVFAVQLNVFAVEVNVSVTETNDFVREADDFVTEVDAFVTEIGAFVTEVDAFIIEVDAFVTVVNGNCDITVTLGTNSGTEDTSIKDVILDVVVIILPIPLAVFNVDNGQLTIEDETDDNFEFCVTLKIVLVVIEGTTSGGEIKLAEILDLKDTGKTEKL